MSLKRANPVALFLQFHLQLIEAAVFCGVHGVGAGVARIVHAAFQRGEAVRQVGAPVCAVGTPRYLRELFDALPTMEQKEVADWTPAKWDASREVQPAPEFA